MARKWRLTERTRTLLTLELAIVLPAAALMGFSIWNLKHIQRDQAIEAAIQRDFSYVLKIAEKKSWEKANELVAPVRKEFPDLDDGPRTKARLEHILLRHPEYSYAALYDKKSDQLISRIQPCHDQDAIYRENTEEDIKMLGSWLPVEASTMAKHLHLMEEKEEQPVAFYGGWTPRGNQTGYWNIAYFLLPDAPKDRVTLGVVAFDEDYVRKNFLPAVMKDVLMGKSNVLKADANPPIMMIHPVKDSSPWVASGNWDGGKPEAERRFADVFPEMMVAIKYQGTTVADIGTRFLHYNYMVLAALSVFMVGGIWLTYRNVSREMTLARLKSDFVANV